MINKMLESLNLPSPLEFSGKRVESVNEWEKIRPDVLKMMQECEERGIKYSRPVKRDAKLKPQFKTSSKRQLPVLMALHALVFTLQLKVINTLYILISICQ